MSVTQISATQLQLKLQNDVKPLLLDVREPFEFEIASVKGSLYIPMNQIPQRLSEIDVSSGCVVICHHGIRSQQVADFLVHSGFNDILNLAGGIDAWSIKCDNTVSRY